MLDRSEAGQDWRCRETAFSNHQLGEKKPVIEVVELVKQGGVGLQLLNKASPGRRFQRVKLAERYVQLRIIFEKYG